MLSEYESRFIGSCLLTMKKLKINSHLEGDKRSKSEPLIHHLDTEEKDDVEDSGLFQLMTCNDETNDNN